MSGGTGPECHLRLRHLVYGSFADRPDGHHFRVRSPGIGRAVEHAIERDCDNWGEIAEPLFQHALSSHPLLPARTGGAGPLHTVEVVSSLGVDAGGRRGARMHHILVLSPDEFLQCGADPFLLASSGAMLFRWDPDVSQELLEVTLPSAAEAEVEALRLASRSQLTAALRIVTRLLERPSCLFYVERAEKPLRDAFRLAWCLAPLRLRSEIRFATFAFINNNDYNLAALYSDLAPMCPVDIYAATDDLATLAAEAPTPYLSSIGRELDAGRLDRAVAAALGET